MGNQSGGDQKGQYMDKNASDYQKYMKQGGQGGDYQKYMKQDNKGGDYQKYMKQGGGDYQKYMNQNKSGGDQKSQYMEKYAGDYKQYANKGGDYQKYQRQGGDYKKYEKQGSQAGDYQKFMNHSGDDAAMVLAAEAPATEEVESTHWSWFLLAAAAGIPAGGLTMHLAMSSLMGSRRQPVQAESSDYTPPPVGYVACEA